MLNKYFSLGIVLSLLSCFSHATDLFEKEVKEERSVVIMGGGVGALTSAIYLARSGITPVVIEGKVPGGALAQSPKVQNWPGEMEISGQDLMEKIHKQAEQNGVIFLQEEVVSVDLSKKPFTIVTQDLYDPSQKNTLQASSCIIATGSEPRRLHVKGEEEFWSRGVYSCAVCDGALYKGKKVAVIGGGDAALIEAQYLSQIAEKVYVIVRKGSLKANEKQREESLRALNNVEFVFESQVQEIKGNEQGVEQIVLIKGSSPTILDVNAVFLAIGARPNSQLFSHQLNVSDDGYIMVNQEFETSVSGVYAIGDIVDPYYKQAISAAGDGAKAALKLHHYLVSSSKKPALVVDTAPSMHLTAAAKKIDNAPSTVIEISSYEQFVVELQTSSVPVLVDFYASWCGPCRHLSPKLDTYAKELAGKAKILKVNVQSQGAIADMYQIKSMPTLVVVDTQGKQLERKIGAREILAYLHTLK